MAKKADVKTTFEQALIGLHEVRDGLEHGFEATNDMLEKHKFFKAIRTVNREIEAILVQRLDASTEAYRPLTDDIQKISKTLKELEARIDEIVTNVERGGKIIAAIEKVIKVLAKFVP
jgi:CII-binding regulator of phage lambda lysogenization HflD